MNTSSLTSPPQPFAPPEKLQSFWSIINEVGLTSELLSEEHLALFEARLKRASFAELVDFHCCFEYFSLMMSQNYDLQDAAALVCGGLSDDSWHYGFTPWLISQGKTNFEQIFSDPEELMRYPRNDLFSFEDLPYLITDLLDTKCLEATGTEFSDYTLPEEYCLPLNFTPVGSNCDTESYELEEKFPRLFAYFYGNKRD